MYYIYKYIEDNENNIKYIGKTVDLKRRIYEHSREEKFNNLNVIYYFQCTNQKQMDLYEFYLINKYHPPLNITDKIEDLNIEVNEPKWTLYKEDDFKDKKLEKTSSVLNDYEKFTGEKVQTIWDTTNYDKTKIDENCGMIYELSLVKQKCLLAFLLTSKKFNIDLNQVSLRKFQIHSILKWRKESKYSNDELFNNDFFIINNKNISLSQKGINILKNFINFDEDEIENILLNITSKYTLLYFNYILEYRTNEIPISFLKKITCYTDTRDLKQRSLFQTLNDLENILNYKLKYNDIKQGKKIIAFQIVPNKE